MTKLFSECLIEKKLASQDQVLAALMEQLRSVPSTAEVVDQLNLLPKAQLFEILVHQQYTDSDFRSSALALGFWTAGLSEAVKKHLRTVQRSLGEILIANGHMTIEKLTAALDTYVESSSQSKEEAKYKANPIVFAEDQPKSAPIVAKKPRVLDSVLVQEYLDCYSKQIRPALEAILKKIPAAVESQDQLRSLLRSSHSEFVALRAAAGFLDARLSEGLADRIAKGLEALVKSESACEPNVAVDVLSTACLILDSVSVSLRDSNSEDLLESDPSIRDLVDRLTQSMALVVAQAKEHAA